MGKYCFKKLVRMIIVMFLISFFSFAVIYFAPGDISDMYVTADMTEEQTVDRQLVILQTVFQIVAIVRKFLGLLQRH